MRLEKVHINELISPDWNPRQITQEELQKLETSLKEFGYIEPLIVNNVNMHIVGGNQRFKVLQKLGYTDVDVIFIHIEDIAAEKALNLALNKISGQWDINQLEVILDEIRLSPIDITLTGFDELELESFDPTDEQHTYDDAEDDNDIIDDIDVIICPRCNYEIPKE